MAGKKRDSRVSVRAAIVLEHEGKVLLVKHVKGENTYWVFPGGRLHAGETIEACGRRELKEEVNIDIRVGPLLYVSDRITDDAVDVNIFFRGYLLGGDPSLGHDPEEEKGSAVLRDFALVTEEEFRRMEILPPEIKEAVLLDWESGFRSAGRYIESRSY